MSDRMTDECLALIAKYVANGQWGLLRPADMDALVAEARCARKREAELRALDQEKNHMLSVQAMELDATKAELERWRHGRQVEGDYVCPDSLALGAAKARLAEVEEELRAVNVAADDWEELAEREKTRADRAEARLAEAERERRLEQDIISASLDEFALSHQPPGTTLGAAVRDCVTALRKRLAEERAERIWRGAERDDARQTVEMCATRIRELERERDEALKTANDIERDVARTNRLLREELEAAKARVKELERVAEANVAAAETAADAANVAADERDALRAALVEYVDRHEADGNPRGLPEYEKARAALASAPAKPSPVAPVLAHGAPTPQPEEEEEAAGTFDSPAKPPSTAERFAPDWCEHNQPRDTCPILGHKPAPTKSPHEHEWRTDCGYGPPFCWKCGEPKGGA